MSPSEPVKIAPAGPEDMGALAEALEHLSAHMGDTHRADAATLTAACAGPDPACHALLARQGGTVIGAALLSPVFSTTKGCAGVYVSDLWVSDTARGTGLGRKLLRACARTGHDLWRAGFVKLAVYDDNIAARAFYDRLGFEHQSREQVMILDAAPLLETTP
jgi:ribosomal protein S18 acetylase RimI-like enzyme